MHAPTFGAAVRDPSPRPSRSITPRSLDRRGSRDPRPHVALLRHGCGGDYAEPLRTPSSSVEDRVRTESTRSIALTAFGELLKSRPDRTQCCDGRRALDVRDSSLPSGARRESRVPRARLPYLERRHPPPCDGCPLERSATRRVCAPPASSQRYDTGVFAVVLAAATCHQWAAVASRGRDFRGPSGSRGRRCACDGPVEGGSSREATSGDECQDAMAAQLRPRDCPRCPPRRANASRFVPRCTAKNHVDRAGLRGDPA